MRLTTREQLWREQSERAKSSSTRASVDHDRFLRWAVAGVLSEGEGLPGDLAALRQRFPQACTGATFPTLGEEKGVLSASPVVAQEIVALGRRSIPSLREIFKARERK